MYIPHFLLEKAILSQLQQILTNCFWLSFKGVVDKIPSRTHRYKAQLEIINQ